jgi:putative membrane protein
MKLRVEPRRLGLIGFGMALAAPALAVSLSATGTPQPVPDGNFNGAAHTPAESWAPGSASLVPLMAADTQANPAAAVDAPATGGELGKPIDDVAFVRQATESGRKEVNSAREALPQLKTPELKRIAEMLVNDHSNANVRLAKIAEAKQWPVLGPQAPAAPPSGTASSDFDAKWTAEMIAGHERSIALYKAQASGGEDKELRKYAKDTLPTIEHHLAELKSLQK